MREQSDCGYLCLIFSIVWSKTLCPFHKCKCLLQNQVISATLTGTWQQVTYMVFNTNFIRTASPSFWHTKNVDSLQLCYITLIDDGLSSVIVNPSIKNLCITLILLFLLWLILHGLYMRPVVITRNFYASMALPSTTTSEQTLVTLIRRTLTLPIRKLQHCQIITSYWNLEI